jgi:hypothetical protein
MATDHPTQELLCQFHRGLLSAAQAVDVELHLNSCPECLQILETLPEDCRLVRLLRGLDIGVSVVTPIPGEIRLRRSPSAERQDEP